MVASLTYLGQSLHEQLTERDPSWLIHELRETHDLFKRLGVRGIANDWLLQMPWKRSLAWLMYSDLLDTGDGLSTGDEPRKILEIGGNLSYLTLELARRHQYQLLEALGPASIDDYLRIEQYLSSEFIFVDDWFDYDLSRNPVDLLIANDLFPNTDQRLYEMVDRFLPFTTELRLSLTYYENTFFKVTRDSSGEPLMIRPWGLRELRHFFDYLVQIYPDSCSSINPDELKYEDLSRSVFGNRRNVVYLHIVK